jgi:hypothetical protein
VSTCTYGVNTITAGEAVFLLTADGGDAIHLTRESAQGAMGQEAVPNLYSSIPISSSA